MPTVSPPKAAVTAHANAPTVTAATYKDPRLLTLRSSSGALLMPLPWASNVRVRQAINSLDCLTFDYPPEATEFGSITGATLVRCKGQDYRITGIDEGRGGDGLTATITCEQFFTSLCDLLIPTFDHQLAGSGVTAATVMNAALAITDWTVGACEPSALANLNETWKTPLYILQQIAEKWNGELQFDAANRIVSLRNTIGADYGAALVYRQNASTITCSVDYSRIYTRVYFRGKDGLTNTWGYVRNGAAETTYDVREVLWTDTAYADLAELTWAANLRLAAFSAPRTTYTVDAYSRELYYGRQWIPAQLGDTIRIDDPEFGSVTGYRVFAREMAPFEDAVADRLVLQTSRDWFPEKLAAEEAADLTALEDRVTTIEEFLDGQPWLDGSTDTWGGWNFGGGGNFGYLEEMPVETHVGAVVVTVGATGSFLSSAWDYDFLDRTVRLFATFQDYDTAELNLRDLRAVDVGDGTAKARFYVGAYA